MLLTLIKNEWIKLFKRTKTWIVFLLFIAVVVLGVVALFYDEKHTERFHSPTYQLEMCKQQIKYNTTRANEIKDSKNKYEQNEYASIQAELTKLNAEKQQYEEAIKNSNEKDGWKKTLDKKIETTREAIDQTTNKNAKAKLEQQLAQFKYMKENNLNNTDGWRVNPYKAVETLFAMLGGGLLIIGIAIFMSDIVSGECTPPTLKFLLIQPVSRAKILLSKFIAVTTTVIAMIMSTEIAAFIVVGAIKGFGFAKYPVILGTKYKMDSSNPVAGPQLVEVAGSGYLTTNSEYILKAFLLQILFLFTCCAFVFMISSIFKSSMITMSISVAMVFAVSIVAGLVSVVKKLAHLIFLSYGSVVDVLSGKIATQYNNPNFTITTAIIVMVVTSVVSYMVAHFVFSKRDILI